MSCDSDQGCVLKRACPQGTDRQQEGQSLPQPLVANRRPRAPHVLPVKGNVSPCSLNEAFLPQLTDPLFWLSLEPRGLHQLCPWGESSQPSPISQAGTLLMRVRGLGHSCFQSTLSPGLGVQVLPPHILSHRVPHTGANEQVGPHSCLSPPSLRPDTSSPLHGQH